MIYVPLQKPCMAPLELFSLSNKYITAIIMNIGIQGSTRYLDVIGKLLRKEIIWSVLIIIEIIISIRSP